MSRFSPVHSRKIIKFFKNRGFVQVGHRGDHVTFWKIGIRRLVVVTHPCKDLPIEHIKNNLKTAGEAEGKTAGEMLAELKRFLGRE